MYKKWIEMLKTGGKLSVSSTTLRKNNKGNKTNERVKTNKRRTTKTVRQNVEQNEKKK